MVIVPETFKVKTLSPERMKQKFHFWEPCYTSCSGTSQFRRENIKATFYEIQPVRFRGPKIWVRVPQNIKNWGSLQELKRLRKVWKLEACPRRMYKKYVANIGFIWLNIHLRKIYYQLYLHYITFFYFFYWGKLKTPIIWCELLRF